MIKLLLCCGSLLLTGCGGPLYKVAPLPTSPPPELASNNVTSFSIAAAPLNGDQALEQFDANLPMAGVIAVDLRLINPTAEKIKPGKLKFTLRDADNKKLKQAAPKRALKRVMKFYGNRFYLIEGYRQTVEGYDQVALSLNDSLNPQQERRGFIFFETRRGPANLKGLTLQVAGAPAPISLQLSTP